ncbi:ParB N-terminal domain-containing protein [Streptomyces smyrnaeus]|uniref:ParB N-terminal domain-containing protein n=1 Tax=Streptomyces smyrnaeus TaxID=1387713 RepID=A0ABS3Y684_9ACTN|nr:ParB N-terminal domain-containing protein [Streptomyces smyrnaeus]MBO8203141.1 ParB N-terminal domain-containing protein [Streptomyces smyrnaeus]
MTHASDAIHQGTIELSRLRLDRNVRMDTKLTPDFLRSVKENGIQVPMLVADQGDGTYQVIMGKRRTLAGLETGQTEGPAFIINGAALEAGEDYVRQLIENDPDSREAFTPLEIADALFHAVEEGMELGEVSRRSGYSQVQVKQARRVAKTIGARTRRTLARDDESNYEWTLDQLTILGEFDDDEAAVARLNTAHCNGFFEHQATRERRDREERRLREERRKVLSDSGVQLFEESDSLPADVWSLEELELEREDHAECPGHCATWGAVWSAGAAEPGSVVYLCTAPEKYGHFDAEEAEGAGVARAERSTSEGTGETGSVVSVHAPQAPPRPQKEDGIPYRLKVEGNKAYRAAADRRKEWLRTELLARKSAPKDMPAWVSRQLLTCSKPVQQWIGDAARTDVLLGIMGKGDGSVQRAELFPENPTAPRLNLLNFAVLAASYEYRMRDVQTWRSDRPNWDTEAIRSDAREYLSFLESVGYVLSPIERSIVDGDAYEIPDDKDGEDAEHQDDSAPGAPEDDEDADALALQDEEHEDGHFGLGGAEGTTSGQVLDEAEQSGEGDPDESDQGEDWGADEEEAGEDQDDGEEDGPAAAEDEPEEDGPEGHEADGAGQDA